MPVRELRTAVEEAQCSDTDPHTGPYLRTSKSRQVVYMAPKRALITGITGQDGSYLAEHLLSLDYEVWGIVRRTSLDPMMRIDGLLHPQRRIHLLYGNLRDAGTLRAALTECQPDEIYNLAAQSDVGISFKCPDETAEINYFGVG